MATCRHGDDAASCPTCTADREVSIPPRPADRAMPPPNYGNGKDRPVIVAKCPNRNELGIQRFFLRTGTEFFIASRCVCGAMLARPFVLERDTPSPDKPVVLEHAAAQEISAAEPDTSGAERA